MIVVDPTTAVIVRVHVAPTLITLIISENTVDPVIVVHEDPLDSVSSTRSPLELTPWTITLLLDDSDPPLVLIVTVPAVVG